MRVNDAVPPRPTTIHCGPSPDRVTQRVPDRPSRRSAPGVPGWPRRRSPAGVCDRSVGTLWLVTATADGIPHSPAPSSPAAARTARPRIDPRTAPLVIHPGRADEGHHSVIYIREQLMLVNV